MSGGGGLAHGLVIIAVVYDSSCDCGRRRHLREVLGEVGIQEVSAKSGARVQASVLVNAEPFRNVGSLQVLSSLHTGYYRVPSGAASCIMYYTYYIILCINTYFVLSDPGYRGSGRRTVGR